MAPHAGAGFYRAGSKQGPDSLLRGLRLLHGLQVEPGPGRARTRVTFGAFLGQPA